MLTETCQTLIAESLISGLTGEPPLKLHTEKVPSIWNKVPEDSTTWNKRKADLL